MLDVDLDLNIGVVIEATLKCDAATAPNTTAGLLVRGAAGDTSFLFDCSSQQMVVGKTQWDRTPGFSAEEMAALKVRLLLRSTPTGTKGMAEFCELFRSSQSSNQSDFHQALSTTDAVCLPDPFIRCE